MSKTEYSYKAVAKDGSTSTGVIAAENERQAVLSLQKQGLVPISMSTGARAGEPAPGGKAPAAPSPRRSRRRLALPSLGEMMSRRLGGKVLIGFSENLAMLLASGISLDKSLLVLAELTESRQFRQLVTDVHSRVREGNALAEALDRHAEVFPPVFIGMVRAGESGGILETVLLKLAEYLRSVQDLKEFLISAMIYPLVLILVSIGSIAVLMAVVVPRFASIFEDLGVAVPTATKIMLVAGNFLAGWWWALLAAIVGGALAFRTWSRTPAGRQATDALKLRLPLIGPIMLKIEISRFARTLGTLLANGVPILGALNIVRGVVINSVLREQLAQTSAELKHGKFLSQSLAAIPGFPSLALHMIGVGEETGRLPDMLEKVADAYDKDLRVSIKSFTSVFEPVIILVLGLVIGAMVISMLMAIFSVNDIGI